MNRKSLLISAAVVILAAIAAILVVRAQRSNQAPPRLQLTIADVSNIENALITVAVRHRFFEQRNLTVVRRTFSSGKEALETMVGGQADLATSAETPIVWATLRGDRPLILATLNKTVNKATARRSSKIASLADLKGKRVAFAAGTSADYWLDEVLRVNQIARSDVKLVNLPPPAMVAAITRVPPDVDVFFAWEPHNARARAELKDDSIEFTSAGQYTEFFNLSTRESVIREKPDAIKRFLAALLEAEAFVGQQPTDAQQDMAEFLSLPTETIQALWAENSYAIELGQDLTNELAAIAKWALQSPQAPPNAASLTALNVVSEASLRELAPERVQLRRQP